MGITTRFQHWNHTHQSFLLLIARIVLGVILLLKGIFFISHSQHLKELILDSRLAAGVGFWTGYITFAHLCGGVFIILGLLTRIFTIIQLPVLLGAIFFILPTQGFENGWAEIFLSLFVTALAIGILVKGAGDLSMDDYLKDHLL